MSWKLTINVLVEISRILISLYLLSHWLNNCIVKIKYHINDIVIISYMAMNNVDFFHVIDDNWYVQILFKSKVWRYGNIVRRQTIYYLLWSTNEFIKWKSTSWQSLNWRSRLFLFSFKFLVRKDMDVNEHERLSNITPRHTIK